VSGLFITFEGTEGAGKSTLIKHLAHHLRGLGYAVCTTREPGGSPIAEQIRSIILNHPMDPWTELFLYEASRAEHLAKTVLPALERGEIVLCDRFSDSSLAYQGAARGLDWKKVKLANQLATQGVKPQLTVLLDVDPEAALARAQDKNRFELEGVAFQKKVRAGFMKVAREEPRRWFKLKAASDTPEQLTLKVWHTIEKRLARPLKTIRKKAVIL